MGVSPVR